MNQALIATVGVLAFLVVAVFCMRYHAPVIEKRVELNTAAELAQAGMDWAEPIADGRDITIRGVAPTALARSEAQRISAGIDGVRRVNNELQLPDEVFSPATDAGAYETRITVSTGFVRYTGFVPDQISRETIIADTRKLYPGRRIEDEMVLRADPPENLMDVIMTLQKRFTTYASAEAVISGNRINVMGVVAPGREREAQLLAASLPANFITEMNLNIASGESVEMCQRRLDELMETQIRFEVASAVIRSDSYELLDQLALRIRACGGLNIEVAGHTDSEGLAMKNLELSQRRAEAVAAYLVNQGIAPDQLVPWGYGESRPMRDNSSAAGRAANRRIEFRALN